MNEQRIQAYINLIQQLLNCPTEEAGAQLLQQYRELIDTGVVQVCELLAQQYSNSQTDEVHNPHTVIPVQTPNPSDRPRNSQERKPPYIDAGRKNEAEFFLNRVQEWISSTTTQPNPTTDCHSREGGNPERNLVSSSISVFLSRFGKETRFLRWGDEVKWGCYPETVAPC